MGLSERRACQIVSADRKTIRYRSNRPPEVDLRVKLRDLANERRRFGYRRLFILLRRDGEPSGVNRIYRLYREEGLSVRKRKARRRAVGTRSPILVEARANARWSLDFVHDQFACGRRFRVLNVVDDVTREAVWKNRPTLPSQRVAMEQCRLQAQRASDHAKRPRADRHGFRRDRLRTSCGPNSLIYWFLAAVHHWAAMPAAICASTDIQEVRVSTSACSWGIGWARIGS